MFSWRVGWDYDGSRRHNAHPIDTVILYEYPFNERIRTYLRLEHLFKRLVTLVGRDAPLDHHFALHTLFEMIDVASRADMKSDVMKDLDRQKAVLNSYRGNPAISEQALDQVIGQIEGCFTNLSQAVGKTGSGLSENDWLMGIRSRISIPGGTCEFDLPAYFDWQHKPADERRAALIGWCASVQPLADAIALLLRMLRDTGMPQKVMATSGQFQQNLPQTKTFQLLRLRIPQALGLIPEISGNRLMVAVRLVRLGADGRLHPANEEASFELTLCA